MVEGSFRVAPAFALAALASLGVPAVKGQPVSPYPTSTPADPCPLSGAPPCTLVLAGQGAPSASPECSAAAWTKLVRFTLPDRWSDANQDGSWETVLEIPLDPARSCGCARLRAFLGDKVTGWVLHVGNSPTNNGHGGDEGTTTHAAELQLIERQLSVFTAALFEHRQIERLLDLTLPPVAGKILEVEACDQTLTVSLLRTRDDPDPLRWRLETLSSKLLLSLGPPGARVEAGALYLGFNRVVHALSGPASHGRLGSGVRRVELELSP